MAFALLLCLFVSSDWTSWPLPCGDKSLASDLFAADDRISLVWIERKGESCGVVKVASWDGQSWSSVKQVAESCELFINWADTPKVAHNASFTLVSWPSKLGKGTYSYGVKAAIDPESGFVEPFWLHEDKSESEHGFVTLLAGSDKQIQAIWLDGRAMVNESGTMQLRTRTVSTDGLGPETLLDNETCECCSTSGTMVDGQVHVAYRNKTADHVRDNFIVSRVNGTWSKPAALETSHWTVQGCPVNGPVLAANGTLLGAAWFTSSDGENRVFATSSLNGEPVALGESPMGRLSAAFSANGLFVSWIDAKNKGQVRVVLIDGEPSKIVKQWVVSATPSDRSGGFPRLAILNGKLHMTFQDPEHARVSGAQLELQ